MKINPRLTPKCIEHCLVARFYTKHHYPPLTQCFPAAYVTSTAND